MKRILEIGHGGHPIAHLNLSSFAKKLPPETIYHGIDSAGRTKPSQGEVNLAMGFGASADELNMLSNAHAAEDAFRLFRPANIYLYRMDGRNLAFRSATFDEVHMHSLISHPGISRDDITAMIKEAHRVLVPEGWLVISSEHTIPSDSIIATGFTAGFVTIGHSQLLDGISVFGPMIGELLEARSKTKDDHFVLLAQK